LKKKELKRRIDINSVKGITCSKITEEFIIHGMDLEYDYNYISSKRKIIVKSIAEAYFNSKGTELSFCELDEKSLSKYVTQKSDKKKDLSFSRMSLVGLLPVKNYYAPPESTKNENESIGIKNNVKPKNNDTKISDFKLLKVLGKGSFSKIILAESNKKSELVALKVLKKDLLIEEDQIENTILEHKILSEIENPFILELKFSFQTEERIFLGTPFLSGGDLFQQLHRVGTFSEEK